MEVLRSQHHIGDFRGRFRALGAAFAAAFAVLGLRLWQLQVVQGEQYSSLSAQNSLKEREIPAPRGIVYDATGNHLAEVRPAFDVVLTPSEALPDGAEPELGPTGLARKLPIDVLAQRLGGLLSLPAEEIVQRWGLARGGSRYRPMVVRGDVSPEELARVEARRAFLPGVEVRVTSRRYYPHGGLFCHLIGYLREVRSDELEKLRARFQGTPFGEDHYQIGDLIGKWGIEGAFEKELKGRDGAYHVLVDAMGREVGRSLEGTPGSDYVESLRHLLLGNNRHEVPGADLHLTVRLDLQRLAMDLMGDESGAVVVLEVHTGRVLALVNAPTFDPQIFAGRLPPDLWKKLSTDPAHPLADKALQGIYPPGSTFKMVVAAAGLADGAVSPETTFHCNGFFKLGKRRFRCWKWKTGGHGAVDLHSAIVGSCDVYFYQLGRILGFDRVAHYARGLGLGGPSGIGINSERGGLLPDSAWKERTGRGRWQVGDTISAVIGQGYTTATPMQMAVMTAAIANGGKVYRPYVVEYALDAHGEEIYRAHPFPVTRADVSERHLALIREAMLGVVEEAGGTAKRSRIPGFPYAGKTGTAQVVAQGKGGLSSSAPKRLQDHAWFVAFAPYEDPEIAISVLVENGAHGSTAAAPIARALVEHYYRDRIAEARTARAGAAAAEDADGPSDGVGD